MENIRDTINEIYNHLADALSRKIYGNRLMYDFTHDGIFIREIMNTFEEGKQWLKAFGQGEKKRVIFGAGIWGQDIAEAYGTGLFECFVDNYKVGHMCGLPIISFQDYLNHYRDALVVVSSRLRYNEICQQLLENGVLRESILCAGAINDSLTKVQYFDLPDLKNAMAEEEVFVDGGCLDGTSSIQFASWCGGNYKKIYAFEPDSKNYSKCREILKKSCENKFELIQRGMWSEESELHFTSFGNGCSCINQDGTEVIRVATIDQIVQDRVTFIKMDIEGAEYKALLGAKETIKKYKPKLAICIYHKPEDMWEIPNLILEMNSEYKFYVRHYSISKSETVLYAI